MTIDMTKLTEILGKLPKSKKDIIIEGGKLGKDLVKNITKKFNSKTGRQILSLPKKAPSKTKQINKRTENLKKKQSKSKALVTKGKQIFDKPIGPKKLNISEFMKKPINKQSKSLTVINKTKPKTGTGTSIVPKPNTNVVKKPNTNIVKKNKNAITTTQKPNISTKDLRRKGALATLNLIKGNNIKLGQDALGKDDVPKKKKENITPKVLPKLRPPKAEKPKTSKVTKETLPKVVKKKRSNIVQSKNYDAQYTYDMLKKKGGKEFAKARMSKENFAKVKKYSAGTQGKTIAGLKDLPSKSENPGIHMLPAKAKMNMGFKPMFGGGLVASFYDKPEKVEKYKGNTSVARQVKGYGKAKKKN